MKGNRTLLGGWRRLVLVTVPLLTLAFSSMLATTAQASASTVTTNYEVPLSEAVFVPCAAGGAGEEVVLSGNFHVLITVTSDGSGGLHGTVSINPQGVSGVGLTTGDRYQQTGPIETDNFQGTAGAAIVFTASSNSLIIGSGPGNNFTSHFLLHMTIFPDGTVTSSIDNYSITCK